MCREGKLCIVFNTVENKSKEWGTHPWHWYMSSALSRSLLASPLLWPFCLLPAQRGERREGGKEDKANKVMPFILPLAFLLLEMDLEPLLLLFLPIAVYLFLYSFLPHKELRFIFPALPVLNLCAAVGWARLREGVEERKKRTRGKETSISSFLTILCRYAYLLGWRVVFLSLSTLPLFLAASRKNYPGVEGLRLLHTHLFSTSSSSSLLSMVEGGREGERGQVRLHIGVLAAQTGVSRFGEVWREGGREGGVDVVYSKEEGLSVLERVRRFEFLLLEKEEAEVAVRKRVEGKEGGREGEEEERECEVVEWVEGQPRARRPREILRKLRGKAIDVAAWARGRSKGSSSSSRKSEGWEDVFVKTKSVLALVACRLRHGGDNVS